MKLALNGLKKSLHLIVKIIDDFIDLALEAIAPRTCKTCMVPLGRIGRNNGVADFCHSCNLEWRLLDQSKACNILIEERFSLNWSAVSFRLNEGSTKSIIHACKYSGRKEILIDLGKWFAQRFNPPHKEVVLGQYHFIGEEGCQGDIIRLSFLQKG